MATSSYIDREVAAKASDSRAQSLVERALAGDKHAFGALYVLHMSEIYRYFYYRVGSQQDAEDMTEQVFLQVWQSLDRFDSDRASFRTWLYRVAHNLLVDHYRTDKPTEPLPDWPLPDPEASAEPSGDPSGFGPELLPALQQLKPDYQQVLTLRFINDLSHAEAATIMDRSEGAVRVLQHRALEALRALLEEGPTR